MNATPLPLMKKGEPNFFLLATLFCDDCDLTEVMALVELCKRRNAVVGNA